MILPNSNQMRQIDQCAINRFKIPGIALMENAGLGTVLLMERLFSPLKDSFIPIFIGPGNNGGDGLVIARHLHQRGSRPLLVYLIEPQRLKGDSGANQAVIEKLALESIVCSNSAAIPELQGCLQKLETEYGVPSILVDSIFGTGLDRDIKGHFNDVIGLINKLSSIKNVPVVAVDTPSGLSSDNGSVLGTCVRASVTATYGFAKVGQVLPESSFYTGELQVIDIGIPPEVLEQINVAVAAIDHTDSASCTESLRRQTASHKGTYGHLLIVGGSVGKTGAAILAAKGALRSGCGLVSLCAPASLNIIYESTLTEAMTVILDSESLISIGDLGIIREQLNDKCCIVIGPGIGQDRKTAELVVELYNTATLPMVIDADGLNALAANRKKLKHPPGPRILTPHPGEMGRLTSMSTAMVQADRFSAVSACFEQFKTADAELIILLKGSGSLITDGSTTWINRTGNPAMAAGGMGDVLSGLIGSFICQGLSCYEATRFSVFLHGISGDRLLERMGTGFSSSELADDLTAALKSISRG